MELEGNAYGGWFFGLRDSEQLSGVQRLFQNSLVADADRNQVHIK